MMMIFARILPAACCEATNSREGKNKLEFRVFYKP
jgi:hypothetical protein